jgi:membrane-associated protease RseP (regulator of RpoE activity)
VAVPFRLRSATLLLAPALAAAQPAGRPALPDSAPTCEQLAAMRFASRLSPAQRGSARDLLRLQVDLGALDAATRELVTARAWRDAMPAGPRRGGTADSVLVLALDRELSAARREIEDAVRRVARVRQGADGAIEVEVDERIGAVRPLVDRLGELVSVTSAELFGAARAPTGWIGVSFFGEFIPRYTREGPAQLYCTSPVVEAVVPGGPADRAGVLRGDTILAINGRELRGREVRIAAYLEPGATVTLRARRAGRQRELPIVVERRTPMVAGGASVSVSAGSGGVLRLQRLAGDSGGFTFSVISGGDSEPPRASAASPRRAAAAIAGVAARAPAPPAPPTPDLPLLPPVVPAGASGEAAWLGGASFAPLSADMADALGVGGGVLVTRVGPGTAAADAGLREGDVVRTVGSSAVRSLAQFGEQVRRARSAGRPVVLEVVRRGRAKLIELGG